MTAPALARGARRNGAGRLDRIGWHHPEWAAALVALQCWLLLLAHDRIRAHERSISWVHAQGEWVLMATAMMLPAALPSVRQVALHSKWHRRQRAGAIFAASSLGVWLLFGVVAVSAARWARVPAGAGRPLVATLVLAAVWEVTPGKRRCLRACHPSPALAPEGRKADVACARLGLRHGLACVGACWALMLPMAVAGHSRLPVMVALTAIVVAEEVVVNGARLAPAAAALLVAAAAAVAWA